jgi:hypothetical protein
MSQRFAASGTVENQLHRFFKRDSLASGSVTEIEVMVLFVFQTYIEFLKNPSFLA